MQLDQLRVIAKREYLTRIKTKGFWISTVLLPALMAAWLVVPSLVVDRAGATQKLVLVDLTGRLGDAVVQKLGESEGPRERRVRFDVTIAPPEPDPEAQRRELDRRLLAGEIGAWVWIDAEGLARDRIEYHAENVSNWLTQRALETTLAGAVLEMRLVDAGLDPAQTAQLARKVELEAVRVSEEGSRAEAGAEGFVLAFGVFFTLYLVLILYGQYVLQGVLEEKSSRIAEVVLSAVRPAELMGGKLLGIGLLGLTQLAIWAATSLVLTAPGLVSAMALAPEGMTLPQVPLLLLVHFFLHFLLGYFLYASFYAMVGAAFNDTQEAQQLASVAMIFLVAPVMFLMPVINDPGSTLAVVTSLIPPMTPLLMPLRMALKMPPWWQIALGYLLGVAFTAGVVWLSGRVYRVGILMYGKKPTIPELVRWARHS
jgi:ABC-2 type transport system permease protein